MSADFWAGYASGAIGIVIGNPLDVIKVRLQASSSSQSSQNIAQFPTSSSPATHPPKTPYFRNLASLTTGSAAPILGYGALNALLFVSYNRASAALTPSPSSPDHPPSPTPLWGTFIAGAIGGLATWAVSTPTELIKCRAQLASLPSSPCPSSTSPSTSSLTIARHVYAASGIRGFYAGGTVTALRDSIGYAFYFWSYELMSRWMESHQHARRGVPGDGNWIDVAARSEAAKVLVCGGLAGVVTWASIFPLDVVKTRVQAQEGAVVAGERAPLVAGSEQRVRRMGAMEVASVAYREGGVGVFFRGLGVCSVRAFIVNAVQWATYEWIMRELGQGRGSTKPEGGMVLETS